MIRLPVVTTNQGWKGRQEERGDHQQGRFILWRGPTCLDRIWNQGGSSTDGLSFGLQFQEIPIFKSPKKAQAQEDGATLEAKKGQVRAKKSSLSLKGNAPSQREGGFLRPKVKKAFYYLRRFSGRTSRQMFNIFRDQGPAHRCALQHDDLYCACNGLLPQGWLI